MTDLKSTWVLGEQYAHTDQNDVANAVNAASHAKTLSGTYSSIPAAAAGNVGALYFCTDCDAVYQSSGSAWSKIRIGAAAGPPMADPPFTGWTGSNMQSGASWVQDVDGMLFTVPTIGSSENVGLQYRAYPSSPFTLTVNIDALLSKAGTVVPTSSTYMLGGIAISDGTKMIVLGPAYVNLSTSGWSGASAYCAGLKYANPALSSAFLTQTTSGFIGGIPRWFRLVDDGTTMSWRYSMNGFDWATVLSEARTTFLTPTRIGIAATNCSGAAATLRLRSWTGVS